MIQSNLSLDAQLRAAVEVFQGRYGRAPRFAAAAPGRVNLIGEHTDYNDGFVLPMAMERRTLILAAARDDANAVVASTGADSVARFEISPGLKPSEPKWANYVRGVVVGCLNAGMKFTGFDALVDSTVPLGSGLSSSAALEVATATLLEAVSGTTLDPVKKALLCQKAEHDFPRVPCGIMDQFISVMGQQDHALLLDCRSHATRLVRMSDPGVAVLITNTNVKHELTGGEYAQRRAQCETAAKAMGVPALRDLAMKDLVAAKDRLDPLAYRRAYHVVGENARTTQAADEIAQGVWASVGRLMLKSHASLRDDFEVSCAELDILVELAQELVTKEGGVWGARMTGGGFGGCTITLLRADRAAAVAEHLHKGYRARTGIEPTFFLSRPAAGAGVVRL